MFFETSFPHYEVIADDMIAEGNKVSVLAWFRGVHNGDLRGIAPTGKQVEMPFAITYRLDEGKIIQHWMKFDRMALMEQLGIAPAYALRENLATGKPVPTASSTSGSSPDFG